MPVLHRTAFQASSGMVFLVFLVFLVLRGIVSSRAMCTYNTAENSVARPRKLMKPTISVIVVSMIEADCAGS